MSEFLDIIVAKYNYWAYTALMMIGLWGMVVKNNLIKKVVGMSIFQTAIILFYVSMGFKKNATIPILSHDAAHGGGHEAAGQAAHAVEHAIKAADYINPLPHVLMLTAIVVAVATLGVALALGIKVYQSYGTLEEDEIQARLRKNL
jgi:multicomponent Na+:H+ antiporter subunit C